MPDRRSSANLNEALAQIGAIRAQLNEATVFRGYRASTVAMTGGLAMLGALVQAALIPDPVQHASAFVMLWVGIAAMSVALVAIDLAYRYRATDSQLARRGIWQAVEQFMPCVVAGALVTVALLRFVPTSAALLPGLWGTTFSLGIFASWRRWPRPCLLIGAYYLLAGTALIASAADGHSLSPYGMGAMFGMGQLATAAALHFTLERGDATSETE